MKHFSLSSLLNELNEDFEAEGGFPYQKTTLEKLIKEMGFKYKKIDKRIGKLNSPTLKVACGKYWDKITKFREENRNIVYLDETWYFKI